MEIINSLTKLWDFIPNSEEYYNKPPKGPPEHLPTLSEEEIENLSKTFFGDPQDMKNYAYESLEFNIEGDMAPKEVKLPNSDDLKDINVCAIDGSNQRIDLISFYVLLARATIINFRYSKPGYKPYFYTRSKDCSGVVWVDGNIFNEEIETHTKKLSGENIELMSEIEKPNKDPFLFRYDPSKSEKSPSSQALGWSVKLQQALELAMIKEVPKNAPCVCIRDGPLFSTSVAPKDTIQGLSPIFTWKDQVLISCSKRVKESSLLVESLIYSKELRDFWFPKQEILESTLRSVATDALLIPKILKPGQRTPFIAAVPRARKKIVEDNERLTPLVCYYYSRHRPNTFIRLEVPKFMYERNKEMVEKAIQIVAWQHEMGHRAPLVQLAADERCQLGPEKKIVENQIRGSLARRDINLSEIY